jgi:SAM-dependent methyltransferase
MGAEGEERGRVGRIYRGYENDPRRQQRWSAENPGNQAIRAELVTATFALAGEPLRAAGAVLDVGCGTGWWLAELASRPEIGASLHGLELLRERVAAAGARVPEAQIVNGDVRELPYEDGSFAVVTLFTVLSSLATRDDVAVALREAARVAAPGGSVLAWEPRIPNSLNRTTIHVGAGAVRSALAEAEIESRTLTLAPPIARRLGPATGRLYPLLAAIPPLRTHRLTRAVM